jgi:hypothetical protein
MEEKKKIVVENDKISPEGLATILHLIILHRIQYKKREKAHEQKLRSDLITKDVREDYNAQLKSDCKKWRKRMAESRLIILKELGVSMELFERELSKLSKDDRSEKAMYNKVLKELSETPEYASTKKKAKDYLKEFNDCLENQMVIVAAHPEITKEFTKELGSESNADDLYDIMALDQMYSTYKITYTELCMAKLLTEKSSKK